MGPSGHPSRECRVDLSQAISLSYERVFEVKSPKSPCSLNIFFASRKTGAPPGLRKWADAALRRIGPTWRFAPARRAAQVLSLGLFLYSFFYVAWPYSHHFSATTLSDKEWLPLEIFLWLDPLSGISTAVAARCWNVGMFGALSILLLCLFFPRGFCGYLCPLGTLIDGVDWLQGKRSPFSRRRSALRHQPSPGNSSESISANRKSKIQNLKYFFLLAILTSSLFGVLLAGFGAAIPVLTRGLMFTAARLQLGLMKDWSQLGPMNWASYASVALFAAIFVLAVFGRRFWCRCLCPTGAVFSLANAVRLSERCVVKAACIECGRCVDVCPFDAINDDFSTRPFECTFCQTCGGACPTQAIEFRSRVGRIGNPSETGLKEESRQVANLSYSGPVLSRRGFVATAICGSAAALAIRTGLADGFRSGPKLLRPPGSVPEDRFLDLCIRCGECFKVCPGPVLHPAGLEGGFEAMWTPVVVPTHAGCHQDCNFCTQVCPTGAIRPLPIEVKRTTHMGLAVINPRLCLPHRGERDCQLCYEECEAAGYHAIEMREIRLAIGPIPEGVLSDEEMERASRIKAPFILRDKCVGCGLCEYRCHVALVKQESVLPERAVVVVPENEDRII